MSIEPGQHNRLVRILDYRLPKDGRWFLGGSHVTLLVVAMLFLELSRSWLLIFSAFATGIATELLLFYSTRKYEGRPKWDRVFSAVTEAAGLLILIRPSSWPFLYVFTAFVAVSSKYLFRLDDRRHMFNPTNFALVVAITFLPNEYLYVLPDEYGASNYPILHITVFGLLAVWRADRWRISMGYQGACFILSALLAFVFRLDDFFYFWGPEVGAYGLIFTWLMITDPKSTPSAHLSQWIFGILIAGVVFSLRLQEILYPRYIALFFFSSFRGMLWWYGEKQRQQGLINAVN